LIALRKPLAKDHPAATIQSMHIRCLILPLLLLLGACTAEDIHETRFMMGTLVDFTISNADEDQARDAINAASAEMMRVEQLFTIYGPRDNAVKRFNQGPVNTPLRLPSEISALLQIAVDVQQHSQASFHPALAVWNRLWGFSHDPLPSTPPTKAQITAARPGLFCLQHVDSDRWLRHDQNCQLDFGAIAKGYAIDRGIAVLRQHGIRHAIINAGGDMRVIGLHHDIPWRIGIRHPRRQGDILGYVSLQGDISIVTSGDYERFYIFRGRRYHHILNPRTGYPAERVQSATVIYRDATLADAWSTALFVMGKAALPILQRRHMAAMIVTQDGHIIMNTAMKSRFHGVTSRP